MGLSIDLTQLYLRFRRKDIAKPFIITLRSARYRCNNLSALGTEECYIVRRCDRYRCHNLSSLSEVYYPVLVPEKNEEGHIISYLIMINFAVILSQLRLNVIISSSLKNKRRIKEYNIVLHNFTIDITINMS